MPVELDTLQGTWRVVALEVDGTRVARHAITAARVVVEGSRFESVGMGARYGGTLLLGSGHSPRELELRFDRGPHAGLTSFGICDLAHDTWLLCLGLVGRPRPRRFATTTGSGHALQVLQRIPVTA